MGFSQSFYFKFRSLKWQFNFRQISFKMPFKLVGRDIFFIKSVEELYPCKKLTESWNWILFNRANHRGLRTAQVVSRSVYYDPNISASTWWHSWVPGDVPYWIWWSTGFIFTATIRSIEGFGVEVSQQQWEGVAINLGHILIFTFSVSFNRFIFNLAASSGQTFHFSTLASAALCFCLITNVCQHANALNWDGWRYLLITGMLEHEVSCGVTKYSVHLPTAVDVDFCFSTASLCS